MSEFQYYEFQTIDRPLTDEEQADIRKLSSRVEPTAHQAIFTYSFGDFRADPEQVLAQYFDAMLYLANWGTKQLMFRIPKSFIDLEQIEPYCLANWISYSVKGEYIILDLLFYEDGGEFWVEGEGWLSSLVSLRDDIMSQDYRVLYLAWLRAIKLEYIDEDILELPVPPGLRELSKPLRDFVELFDVDKYLLQVATESSTDREVVSDEMLRQLISKLPREECDEFLLRLVQGELHLSIELNRRLQKLIGISQPQSQQQRTIRQLIETAEQEREREEKRLAEEAEAKRIQELETLAKQEEQIWQDVDALIQKKQTKAYDEAVQLLLKLQELAVYKEQESVFQERLNQIYEQYRRRPGLLSRLRDADLQQG
jgi:hypothetical protein